MNEMIGDSEFAIYSTLLDLRKRMIELRPTERGEEGRRYAIAITEIEKVIGYWNTYLVNDERRPQ